MTDRPLIDYIVDSFEKLGGRAALKQVYEKVLQLGYQSESEDLNKLIRKRIYEHSSDSPQFIKSYPDRFKHYGEGRFGEWRLRKPTSLPCDREVSAEKNFIEGEQRIEEEKGLGKSKESETDFRARGHFAPTVGLALRRVGRGYTPRVAIMS